MTEAGMDRITNRSKKVIIITGLTILMGVVLALLTNIFYHRQIQLIVGILYGVFIIFLGMRLCKRYIILEDKLEKVEYYDDLTDLPNKTFMRMYVDKMIAKEAAFSMIHLNIDSFKQMNDILGSETGDEFLKYIAQTLSLNIQKPNRIARLGGDKFAIVLMDMVEKEDIISRVERLMDGIGKSWNINYHDVFISFSIGVAICKREATNYYTLYRDANLAMNHAKKEGRGRIEFYSEQLLLESLDNIKLSRQLQYAIPNHELVLYYQPQYSLETGKTTGVEALVRWMHPHEGCIMPARFIPIAEETGQIYEIEQWIVDKALQQKLLFEQEGKGHIVLSINLSSRTLSSELNFQKIENIFKKYHVNYSHIVVEITETAIIKDVGFAIDRLRKLRSLGLKIALDDFGTGYSSLIHLKDLPIDIVKLDRSFTKHIEEKSKAAMIIKALLYLTSDLEYEVVAEGIETMEQYSYLKKHKCETGQGYLMSKPKPIEEIDESFIYEYAI